MTQNDLNRAVARSTGETVTEIAERGFQPLTAVPYETEANDGELDQYLDWDELDSRRPQLVVA